VGNTGVLPVRIQIPQHGDRYTAHAFYIPPDASLAWTARVASPGAQHGLLGLLALLGAAMGALAARAGRALWCRPVDTRVAGGLAVLAVLAVLLAVYFGTLIVPLPGFVLLGVMGGWSIKRIRRTATVE
jgi:hypothetical protein